MVVFITCLGMPELVFNLLDGFRVSIREVVSKLMKIKADNVYVMAPSDLIAIYGQWLVVNVQVISMERPSEELLEKLWGCVLGESVRFATAHLPHCQNILASEVIWISTNDVKLRFPQEVATEDSDD